MGVVLCACYALYMTPVNISPLLVAALVSDLSLTADQAGFVLTVEFFGLATTSVMLSSLASRLPLKRVLLGGAGLAIVGNMLALQAGSIEVLIVFRFIAGVGLGVLLLGINMGIARTPDPVKLYGLATTTGLVVAAILFLMLPAILEQWAITGAYGLLVLLSLFTFLIILFLPEFADNADNRSEVTRLEVSGIKLVSLILALLLISSTYVAFYVFSERIGTNTGLSSKDMATLLALIQIPCFLATGLASWLGSRFGLFTPLLIAVSGQALAILIATQTESSFVFVVSFFVNNALFLFSLPYQLGIGAALDETGRVASIAGGTFIFGSAIGPYLGGYLIESQGISSIGLVTCASVAIALPLCWYVTRRIAPVVVESH